KDGTTDLGSGTLDGSGHATLSLASLTAGTHHITASYAGDTNFDTSVSDRLDQTVYASSTGVGLGSAPNPSAAGQGVTYTATVGWDPALSVSPTGPVSFYDGSTYLGDADLDPDGVAAFDSSPITA